MTMRATQLALLAGAAPTVPDLIDLRCCDIAELLDGLDEQPAIVFADPPWDYAQRHGKSRADNHYNCLSRRAIADHVQRAAEVVTDARLVLWITWPQLGPWEMELRSRDAWDWTGPITGGAWNKGEAQGEHYGQGYHWAGCSEAVLIYRRGRPPKPDATVMLRNACGLAPSTRHSEKPVPWQAEMIRRWCPPGGLVLDLYAGMGSVARATLMAGGGRRYLGAEIDEGRHAAALSLIAQRAV